VHAFDNPAIHRHDWNGKVLDYFFLKEPDLLLIVLDQLLLLSLLVLKVSCLLLLDLESAFVLSYPQIEIMAGSLRCYRSLLLDTKLVFELSLHLLNLPLIGLLDFMDSVLLSLF